MATSISNNKGCANAFYVVLCIIGLWTLKNYIDKRNSADNSEAFIISQDYVKRNLKSPSTASFGSGWEGANNVSKSGNTFTINHYVDAQNSFGSTLRSYYECVLTYNGGENLEINNWTLNYLSIDHKVIYDGSGYHKSGNDSLDNYVEKEAKRLTDSVMKSINKGNKKHK